MTANLQASGVPHLKHAVITTTTHFALITFLETTDEDDGNLI